MKLQPWHSFKATPTPEATPNRPHRVEIHLGGHFDNGSEEVILAIQGSGLTVPQESDQLSTRQRWEFGRFIAITP